MIALYNYVGEIIIKNKINQGLSYAQLMLIFKWESCT